MTGKRFAISAIRIILILVILYFVYVQLSKNWQEAVNYSWQINIPILILSLVLHLITFVFFSYVWSFIIGAFGYRVKLRHAFKISYIANLGRYIPGKIWPVFGMAYLARQLKINEESSVTSWAIAMIFTLPSAFMAGAICVLFSPELFESGISGFAGTAFYLALLVIFIISLILIVWPGAVFSLVNKILKRLKRPTINFNINIKTALFIYSGYVICWFAFGLAFWLFVSAITSSNNLPIIPSVASFIIAYQIGYLAFFAPGGIGVRELVLTAILAPYIGPVAAGIAVAARIWNIIAEIIAATIAWFIKLSNGKD
jgi:uncharacterized membrane protein YbhN (UPF0104 family)